MSLARAVPPAPQTGSKSWTTPRILWASVYTIWALDALLLCAAIVGAQVHGDAIQTIGKDSAPSMIAAQQIRSAFSDMDANLANELLGKPGEMEFAVKAYESRKREAAEALINAAKNITYPGEKEPIVEMQVALSEYSERVQRARDLHERNDPGTLNAYRAAAKIMDQRLLPSAIALDKVNGEVLENTFETQGKRSVASLILLGFAGLALIVAMLAVQNFLLQRMRRIVNPMLAAATLIAFAFTAYVFVLLLNERSQMRAIKLDAFDSIHSLWQARATAYSANGDESRYLLDQAAAQSHERQFKSKTALLAGYPVGVSLARIADAVAHEKPLPETFKGYFANEARNITFPGEKEAAADTIRMFGDYIEIDSKIRADEKELKLHDDAVKLCIGTKENESNWAFDRFDKALGETIKINQDQFDSSVARGIGKLDYFAVKATVAALVIAVLALFGLLRRIKEYR